MTAYADAVLEGEIVAGPHVRNACQRHKNDLETAEERGLYFDLETARKKFQFFERVLRLSAGRYEGKPFILAPWQCFVIGSLFGWKKASDGLRRFRTAFIEAGKGCGKTPMCGGIGLNMLCADGEARAEVYAAAYNHDQAKIMFRNAVAMVEQSPDLSSRLDLSGGEDKGNIAYRKRSSFFKPISSQRQGKGKSGPLPHCGLLDEVHEHATNSTIEFLDAGTKHRDQSLMLMITNSGSDRSTVCWDYHEYAIKVSAETLQDDAFFAYVCALDKGDEPFKDESCWVKANPGLPEIPGYDYIRNQVTKAKGIPSKESLCRRLNFCEWTDAADAWLTSGVWRSVQHKLDINDPIYETARCWGGLDMSVSNDLTAFSLAFEIKPKYWDLFTWFWMPGDKIVELEEQDGIQYRQWANDGYLHAPPGRVINYEHAAKFIQESCLRFAGLQAVAYDRAKIELLVEKLTEQLPFVPHGQGFFKAQDSGLWMPESIEQTEAAIDEGRLRVNENPCLTWNVASAVTKSSAINPTDRHFDKRKATARIDGAVSMVQAIGAADAEASAKPKLATSIYERMSL